MSSLPSGKAFAEADISTRKELFREAALAHVTLLQQMNSALASKSDHTMPLELFRDILEEHFSDDEVQRQIDTALNWGRYGDIFTYDSESDRLLLHQPANLADDGRARAVTLMAPRSEKTIARLPPWGSLSTRASSLLIDLPIAFAGHGVVLWFALAGALLDGPGQYAGPN